MWGFALPGPQPSMLRRQFQQVLTSSCRSQLEALLKERFRGKKNSKQEGRAFKMDEVVQRGCELCMLHCGTGGDSPDSSESCHRSNMPQTENFTHTGSRWAGVGGLI